MEFFKQTLLGLFVLFVAFSYSIYFILHAGIGLSAESNFFQIYSGLLALAVFTFYVMSFNKIPNKANVYSFCICSFVLVFYYMTQILFGYNNPRYQSYLLSTGVRFVPAILMGAVMIKDDEILQKVEQALLPFILLYTIVLAKIVFTAKVGVNIVTTFNTSGGMSYQSISYYSIFAFGMSMYLIAHGNCSKLKRYAVISLAVLQFMMTIMAGGRGAFVLGIVFCTYYGMKIGISKKFLLYGIIFICIVLLIQVFGSENKIFMQGFNRIFNFFGESNAIKNDNRWIRWGLAFDAFKSSPLIGYGLGSVFYKVGFYSHNIFTDLLCEGGLMLTAIFCICLFIFYRYIRILISMDYRYEIIVIFFICSFVLLCFSGYYLSESGIWLVLSFILNHKIRNQQI